MERKIGEIFEYNGEWYQCVSENDCENCAFNKRGCYTFVSNDDLIGECCADKREDNKDVIFKKLEKVGEPYYSSYYKQVLQEYKYYTSPIISDTKVHILKQGIVRIEIKQTKEDMKEREYSEEEFKNNPRFQHHKNIEQVINMKKMKEFDINLAKQGQPVCTRDGRKARIICFDRNSETQPIVALVAIPRLNGIEKAITCGKNGMRFGDKEHNDDLMMLPGKKNGWVNIYNTNRAYYYVEGKVFKTKDEAMQEAKYEIEIGQIKEEEYTSTIKVEWEE